LGHLKSVVFNNISEAQAVDTWCDEASEGVGDGETSEKGSSIDKKEVAIRKPIGNKGTDLQSRVRNGLMTAVRE
jgi:hypothetical protein